MEMELNVHFKLSSAGRPPKNEVCGTHENSLIRTAIRVAIAKGLVLLPQLVESFSTWFGG